MVNSNNTDKFEHSITELKAAIQYRKKAISEHIFYAGISKCFEVCLEYAWKYLKRELDQHGLEAYSPKEIVKTAGRAGLIDEVEEWITFINIRNSAVHDYLGITPTEYMDLIERFIPQVTKLIKNAGR